MAKALMGGMRQAGIGPNILMTAARAGVLVDRRREAGTGSKYMKGLGEWVVQREVSVPLPEVAENQMMEQLPAEELEKVSVNARTAADKVIAGLVELDVEVEATEVVPV